MLFVPGVGHRLQVVFITGRSAHVLWGRAPSPGEAAGIRRSQIRQDDGFQQQVVPPAITEVIQVLELGSHPRDSLPQPDAAFVDNFAFV